jgi:DNA-binding LacI/PurR family transcriptional regulator
MPTIKDVARMAHVSPATVSYVLNESAPVSVETRARVLAAVASLGYQPHQQARNLQRQRTGTLGMIWLGSDEASDLDLGALLVHCVGAAARLGYSLLVLPSPEQAASGRGVADGWIVLGDTARSLPGPAVWARYPPRGLDAVAVVPDGAAAARRAVASFINIGRQRIALILPPTQQRGAARWYLGYRQALRQAGLPFDPTLVVETPGIGAEDGAAALETLLAGGSPFDAILACGAHLAYGVASAAADHPWSLIAGADSPLVAGAGISALHWPADRWGALLVERLVAMLDGADPPPWTSLNPSLIVRHSSF